jgi:hypothetical protein
VQPTQPLPTPQPATTVVAQIPRPTTPNPTPGQTPILPPIESPSNGNSGENPRVAAAVARGMGAVASNNFSGAIAALQEAASIDRGAGGVGRLRGELRRRGRNRIDDLILAGNCGQAQQLYRQLRAVGAAPGTDSFGDACPAP